MAPTLKSVNAYLAANGLCTVSSAQRTVLNNLSREVSRGAGDERTKSDRSFCIAWGWLLRDRPMKDAREAARLLFPTP